MDRTVIVNTVSHPCESLVSVTNQNLIGVMLLDFMYCCTYGVRRCLETFYCCVAVRAQAYKHDTALHTDVHNMNCYKPSTQEAASVFLQPVEVSTTFQTPIEKLTKYVHIN